MIRSPRKIRWPWLVSFVLTGFALLVFLIARDRISSLLFDLTGEEQFSAQIKGLTDLAADLLRPRLHLAADTPIQHVDVNPFSVNVFLNEEVEPEKRELTVRLAAGAGFHWLRQEFPWQDIEIHGKGDFEDRRNQPYRSAWDKYDQIVDLADKHGMELIVRVSTPPKWTRAAGDEVGTFAPPDNYDDFGDFMYALVSRYRGRIHYYQIWNEPNIYPEWGTYTISPEDYTQLLKVGATRAREADPDVVIICGALASTIALQPAAPAPYNALNDLIFLQRMYAVGAAPYFDIMAMQAYGLWSGPTDRRMHPRVMNFGRPQFVRDLMVSNGDALKPIWISEMGWDAVPADLPDQRFGRVTSQQQASYTPLAYDRALSEWPWSGTISTWYFKRATDEWVQQNKPEAYFRLADPDFTLQPVYYAMKEFIAKYQPRLSPGIHRPDGWAISVTGDWNHVASGDSPYGFAMIGASQGAALEFAFSGDALAIQMACPMGDDCAGGLIASVDDSEFTELRFTDDVMSIGRNLGAGLHYARIEVDPQAPGGNVGIAAFIVSDHRIAPWPLGGGLALLVAIISLVTVFSRQRRFRSRSNGSAIRASTSTSYQEKAGDE